MRPGTFSPLRLRLWLSLCLACVCLVCLRPTCPLGGLFVCSLVKVSNMDLPAGMGPEQASKRGETV